MFETWIYSMLSVGVVSSLSLIGIVTFLFGREVQRDLLLYLVSFSVGGLLGGTFFHLLPEAVEHDGFTAQVSLFVLFGILTSFVAEKFLKWRHCHVPTSREHPHSFAYMNLFGDSVHNMIDGLSIGGAYLISTSTGLATTLAVCLHELPQEIGDFGILLYAGLERRTALLYNFLTALTAFIGAIAALLLSMYVKNIEFVLVPFAAGNFIYIAGSDLIPELHSEERLTRSTLQLVSMILGILLIFSLRALSQ